MWSKVSSLQKEHRNEATHFFSEATNLASSYRPSDLPTVHWKVRRVNHYTTATSRNIYQDIRNLNDFH